MGRVYDAQPLTAGSADARVALKVLRRERNENDHVARFRQEAKAASRVGHSAIVQMFEFAELHGVVYLAMERLYGQSFEDWLEAPGRLRDGLRWMAEVARGLHAAHEAGIVHRDIKPANLFLHRDPVDPQAPVRAKILDFGIAKVVTGDATRIETQAGTLLGTPYYLAPERALGRPLDGRADLYSLGVLLYEVLTGLIPFDDENFMGILAQHIKAQPLDPRQAAPDRTLPEGVCRLAMQLLAKEPDDRPPHGNAVAERLEALIQAEGAAIDAVTTGPRLVSTASDATIHMQELALRPTAAPDPGASQSEANATQALGSGSNPVVAPAAVSARASTEHGAGAVASAAASAGSGRVVGPGVLPASGPMEFATAPVDSGVGHAGVALPPVIASTLPPVTAPVESPATASSRRWWGPLTIVAVLLGAAAGWMVWSGALAGDEAPAADPTASPTAAEAGHASQEDPGAVPAVPDVAPADAAVGDVPAPPDDEVPSVPPVTVAEPEPGVASAAPPGDAKTPAKAPRPRRPRPRPKTSDAPGPPEFKDDVYD